MDLKQWWLANNKPAICVGEYLYREQTKPCGEIPKSEFREKIKGFRQAEACPTSSAKENNNTKKIIQLTDIHIPYEDKNTLKAVFDFIEYFKPDQIVLTGDILDFYSLSRFSKDPAREDELQKDIDKCIPYLQRLTELCPEIHFIEGNHERRIVKYLYNQAPALSQLRCLEFANLMQFQEIGIIHHTTEYLYNGFRFHHGKYATMNAAKKELENYGKSTSQGHSHRLEMWLKTGARGMIGSYNMGCLCDLNPDYVEGIANWQQGFGVFHFQDDRFYCQQVPIIKNHFIYDSRRF